MLSKYTWENKDKNVKESEVKWSTLKRNNAYNEVAEQRKLIEK